MSIAITQCTYLEMMIPVYDEGESTEGLDVSPPRWAATCWEKGLLFELELYIPLYKHRYI